MLRKNVKSLEKSPQDAFSNVFQNFSTNNKRENLHVCMSMCLLLGAEETVECRAVKFGAYIL